MHIALDPETGLVYAYGPPGADAASSIEAEWQLFTQQHGLVVSDGSVSRLQLQMDLPGASFQTTPRMHYVVETDPQSGWSDEIFRWYNSEHMPGLAAVPGCVRARRYINLDNSPQSFACYDLVSREVLGSPPWLAVRHTAWSDRCRPHFTNTLRTMMEIVV